MGEDKICPGSLRASNFMGIHQDTSEALANLAEATISNHKAAKNLTDTNNHLITQLVQSINQLAQENSDIFALRKQMS